MKKTKKMLIAFLCLILCLCQLIACSDKEDPIDTTTSDQASDDTSIGDSERPRDKVDELIIISNDISDYTIVYSQTAKSWEKEMAVLFKNTLKALTGVELAIKDDYEKDGTEDVRTDKEIIIGSTNRENEYDVGYEDFDKGYRIFTDYYRLIIAGGSESGLYFGVQKFFLDFYEVDIQSDALEKLEYTDLFVASAYDMKYKSVSAELPFLQVPLSNYTVVYNGSDTMEKRAAINIAAAFKNITGVSVKTGTSGESGKQIKLTTDSTVAAGKFTVTVSGTDINFNASDYYGFEAVCSYLWSAYTANGYFNFTDGFVRTDDYKNYLNDLTESTKYAYTRGAKNRVMFYNALWGSGLNTEDVAQRQALQVEMLSIYMPDVIGFQEFIFDRSGNNAILANGLSSLGYAETIDHRVNNSYGNNFTPLFYNTDTTNKIESGFYWYTNQGTDVNNDKSSKALTWGVFESKETGVKYIVVSTHLCTQSDEIGALQAAEAKNVIDQLVATYDCPVFIGGDFNATGTEETYKYFANTAGYTNARDAAEIFSSKVRSYHAYPQKDGTGLIRPTDDAVLDANGMASIDHVMLHNADDVTVNVFGIVVDDCTLSASDHLPMFIDFGGRDQTFWTPLY